VLSRWPTALAAYQRLDSAQPRPGCIVQSHRHFHHSCCRTMNFFFIGLLYCPPAAALGFVSAEQCALVRYLQWALSETESGLNGNLFLRILSFLTECSLVNRQQLSEKCGIHFQFKPEDGGRMFLRSTGIYMPGDTASDPHTRGLFINVISFVSIAAWLLQYLRTVKSFTVIACSV